ncbi:hypothetical protein OIU91_11560 [Streptomyces sp. NBC_01456]|uniref:hypothetical protein n=1 Tax=unclassified Streptomyces TaxID=2593676 RepID=UPI002E35460B|nr:MULTISPECIES: hypothetical protein [unclassified Streptomyces]
MIRKREPPSGSIWATGISGTLAVGILGASFAVISGTMPPISSYLISSDQPVSSCFLW